MYPLDRGLIRVKLVDETITPPTEVVHAFREPTPAEWLKYTRESSRLRPVKGDSQDEFLFEAPGNVQALMDLWEALVVEVEGYGQAGEEVTLTDEVKAQIPPRHRLAAAQRLDRVRTRIEGDDRKNSPPPSAS